MKLDRLKEWRDYRGLTQEELAESAGVARYSISNYESGKTSARRRTAERLAEALGVELEDLTTPPARPKVPAPVRSLSKADRRALLSSLAGKEAPPIPGELERLVKIRRAAIAGGMGFAEFNDWFRRSTASEVRDELVPEEFASVEEELAELGNES